MSGLRTMTPAVAIVGAGPAGLSAAETLAERGIGEVLVVEREAAPGGIPRHAAHLGYGIRDRKRIMSGPRYARALTERATAAGARILLRSQVTGWADEHSLEVTSPSGRVLLRPGAMVLATGVRERPRSARMVPGDRVPGVLTTGQLQNLVHLHHQPVGKRAVIVGAELVSWSAAMTLRSAGCQVVALLSRYPKPETYALVAQAGKLWFRTTVVPNTEVVAIRGRGRVEAVEIRNPITGQTRSIPCDTVVFTGDWIPDHEIARLGGIDIDPASGAVLVDQAGQTSRERVFSVGNLNHPVETADVVALAGRHVADQLARRLGRPLSAEPEVELRPEYPLRWISPGRFRPGGPEISRGRLIAWTDEFVAIPQVTVTQRGRELTRTRLGWPASPGRAVRIPAGVLRGVDPACGDVRVAIRDSRR